MKEQHIELLVCPTCKSRLAKIEIQKEVLGLCCNKCQVVYPVKDDIPIILPQESRNFRFECPLIERIGKILPIDSSTELRRILQRTPDLLKYKRHSTAWEWEDEKFWTKQYSRRKVAEVEKNWNDRIW